MRNCIFEPRTDTSSATICKHCGKEKFFHNQVPDVKNVVEDDVEKLAEEMYGKGKVPDYEEGFIDGYNKAKENIYTELINWIDNEILLNPHYKDSSRLKEGVTIVKNRLIIKNEIHKRAIS